MAASVQSIVSAGLAAGLVVAGTNAVIAAPLPETHIATVTSPAVELSAFVSANVGGATTSPGDVLINAYYVIQPWVQYGFELGAWAASWLPWPIGLLGQQVNIAYDVIQPLSEAAVFSLAFLIDGQFDLIAPTLTAGVQNAVNNFIAGEVAFIASFLPPLPPLPFPIFPTAAVATPTSAQSARRATTAVRASAAVAAAPAAAPTEVTPPVSADLPDPSVALPQPHRTSSRVAVRAARASAAVKPSAAVAGSAPAVASANTGAAAENSAPKSPAPSAARVARSAR